METVKRVYETFDNSDFDMCSDKLTEFNKGVSSVAKRHLLPEDVVKLQTFQQKKLAVAHLLNGTEGDVFLLQVAASEIQLDGLTVWITSHPEQEILLNSSVRSCRGTS